MSISDSFDLDRILENSGLDRSYVDNSEFINEDMLEEIYNDFSRAQSKLDSVYRDILTVLSPVLKYAHSIAGRVKDADHLIAKIIRNVNDKPGKYSKISVDNYHKIITDLIGFRIILLDKNDWEKVHKELQEIFDDSPEKYYDESKPYEEQYKEDKKNVTPYFFEPPIAYVNPHDDKEMYDRNNVKTDNSRLQYRSVHYIVKESKFYFELQVRTLFEEGWLEFDHRLVYPNDKHNSKKKHIIKVLNDLAHASDNLISFYFQNEEYFQEDISLNEDSEISNKKDEDNNDSDILFGDLLKNLI